MKSQVIAAVVVLALSCVLASPQPAMGQGQKGNTAGQVLVAQAQGGPGAGARAEEGENHPQIRMPSRRWKTPNTICNTQPTTSVDTAKMR